MKRIALLGLGLLALVSSPVGSGVYFYRLRRLRTGGRVLTKKMILLR